MTNRYGYHSYQCESSLQGAVLAAMKELSLIASSVRPGLDASAALLVRVPPGGGCYLADGVSLQGPFYTLNLGDDP